MSHKPLVYIYLNSASSTNLYIQNNASNFNPDHNICVYTYNQTDGRGQIGRNWYSGLNKNLSLSYFISHNLPAIRQFEVNMVFSLSIYRFLTSLLPSFKLTIKWPNDIYLENSKIAGILIQNSIRGNDIRNSILGVGININELHFPKWIPNPVSLKLKTGKTYELLPLLYLLSDFVIKDYYNQDTASLLQEYNEVLYLRNQNSQFVSGGESFEGVIQKVDESGKLLIKTGGIIKAFGFREISFKIPKAQK